MIKKDVWNNLYPSNWKGVIVDDAIVHPAKFSSKLIKHIYEHMLEEGWLKPGDLVVDPFGGVALGALDAMRLGLRWRGCELEEKFVGLGNANIELWNSKFSVMPGWNTDAVLLQGDSRQLLDVLGENGSASVSSPAYGSIGVERNSKSVDLEKQYSGTGVENDGRKEVLQKGFNASGAPGARPNQVGEYKKNSNSDNYGSTPGQLGAMKAGSFDAAVSSPPFEDREGSHSSKKYADPEKVAKEMAQKYKDGTFTGHAASEEAILRSLEKANEQEYGTTDGNLGNDTGDDFWLAARAIVEQVYLALQPGGHAVWVVKDFVKNKQRVPFCDQWRKLCESVGFVTLHEHHASLVHHKGTQMTLMGESVEIKTESKSFFRRLAEKKGSPRIDWETVWCMEKPSGRCGKRGKWRCFDAKL